MIQAIDFKQTFLARWLLISQNYSMFNSICINEDEEAIWTEGNYRKTISSHIVNLPFDTTEELLKLESMSRKQTKMEHSH